MSMLFGVDVGGYCFAGDGIAPSMASAAAMAIKFRDENRSKDCLNLQAFPDFAAQIMLAFDETCVSPGARLAYVVKHPSAPLPRAGSCTFAIALTLRILFHEMLVPFSRIAEGGIWRVWGGGAPLGKIHGGVWGAFAPPGKKRMLVLVVKSGLARLGKTSGTMV
jgi:hypothetical protein